MAKITVLIVDDEEIDRNRITTALIAQGYSVLEAGGYSDAMAVFDLNRRTVGFLITDVALPDGNGCGLALAIRKQKADIRVLFISFQVGVEACKYYGLTVPNLHLLKKPFGATKLVKRVRKILESAEPFPKLNIPIILTASDQPA